MFYDKQPKEKQEEYKQMLELVGSLSRLFSTAKEPFLYYRSHENIFAKYFELENNARSDDSADAYSLKLKLGIGLKTWVGQNNQKVAEFGRLRPKYEHLTGKELIEKIAYYRNLRIKTTMNTHGLKEMIYHIVKRIPSAMCIYEATFDFIDIENIVLDENRGNENSVYFSDGKHTYHFSRSKNTLYMIFDDMKLLDQFSVFIHDDPYEILENILHKDNVDKNEVRKVADTIVDYIVNDNQDEQLCLRLYSVKPTGEKFVAPKSGLNQWNAAGRTRNPNELYIPYPAEDRRRKNFFPDRDTVFRLLLPDGSEMSAKVCQADSKAIMSNPNKILGKWLLRDVFELPENTLLTYDMLKEFNIDSVIFTKKGEGIYTVDFCELGTYEKFYHIEDEEILRENENAH